MKHFIKLIIIDSLLNLIARVWVMPVVGIILWMFFTFNMAYMIITLTPLLLYTAAYVNRYRLRPHVTYDGLTLCEMRITSEPTNMICPLGYMKRIIKNPLYYLLDDSIYIECGVDYNTNIKGSGGMKRSKNPFVKYIKSLYWSAFRNCAVNYRNIYRLGPCLNKPEGEAKYIGIFKYGGQIKKEDINIRFPETEAIDMKVYFKVFGIQFKFRWGWTLGDGRLESFTIRTVSK